jgi:hypothetical protein
LSQPSSSTKRWEDERLLKAYHQTRSRYLGSLPQRRAFNQIGEALPTVINDGVIVGTWSWNTRTAAVHTDLVPGKVTPALRHQVKTRAAVLTETLRAAWGHPPRLRDASKASRAARHRANNRAASMADC